MFDEMVLILEKHGYKFIKQVGKGCFATCYLVFDTRYKKEFICKVCHSNSNNPESSNKQKFYQNEIDALINITHPNIIKIYNYFEDHNFLYIILEYCNQFSLDKFISMHGNLKRNQLYDFILQFATGLHHCHLYGIAHHDIKPANILLDEYNKIKLADFGFASYQEYDANEVRGSLAYIPPEKINLVKYDPFASDVWSFGVSVYYLAFGSLPFQGETKEELSQNIKKANYKMPDTSYDFVRDIVTHTLVIDPSKRWTMKQIVDYLKDQQIVVKEIIKTKSSYAVRSITQMAYSGFRSIHSLRNIHQPRLVETFAVQV
ncbi:CAMK family protein kinase [Trichomonas vaginalis G3]|uniref:CAMK family protein kinase n=1 Tax=Trichomonas vaginalis (strain ATCC PRA-98 / G3) TaxID=412133 RepID=A2FB54_TRIV3|nr:protein serine/threonine kinase protein [Trichomonas vaginalis G3]EAX97835.1 CAMK family protein kinase [Trichomonas vaginalis G3]KAI5541814.1 protein serine/threonine kinase protein [Trichomonas vaginalis G3]|eukprot:XP_001310765.1 CAMK family protein kinase [Trichomonas vaginalis G3]